MQRDISLPGLGVIALSIAGIALASAVILQRPLSRSVPSCRRGSVPPLRDAPTAVRTTVVAARRLNRAAGTLAVSVLADSAIEHYRGSFENKVMFMPIGGVGTDTGDKSTCHLRFSTVRPWPSGWDLCHRGRYRPGRDRLSFL